VAFAIAAGAKVDPSENLTLEVQGLFLFPFLANGVIAFVAAGGLRPARRALSAGLFSYVLGIGAIFAYQAVVTGSVDPLYALIAPLVPAIIVTALLRGVHLRNDATDPAPALAVPAGVSGDRDATG
jgi:peptidoglycan/LPS O-acetylase OafA/YrhL